MPSLFSSPSSSTFSHSSNLSLVSMERCTDHELHFDLPLISTRRSSSNQKLDQFDLSQSYSTDTSRSVPFLWERAPGVPKEGVVRDDEEEEEEEEIFTPKPPPGHWRPPNVSNSNDNGGGGNVGYANYCTSDASDNDVLSVSNSFGMWAETGIPCRLSVSRDTGPAVTRAPSFIMNRFLPAANALAASSAAATVPKYPHRWAHSGPKDLTKIKLRHLNVAEPRYGQYANNTQRATSPAKACGIMLLMPWNMKRAICGLKSPVRCQTPKMASLDEFRGRSSSKIRASFDHHEFVLKANSDDGVSSKAWKSPGWGLPFLETSRLRGTNKGKSSTSTTGVVERESPRRRDHRGIVIPQLPRLKSPSEPWLANAVYSAKANGRRN